MVYSELRRIARANLRGNWTQSIVTAVVAGILGGGIVSSGTYTFSSEAEMATVSMPAEVQAMVAVLATVIGILALVTFLIGGTIQLGYTVFLMKQYHRQEARVDDLFSQFFRFGTGFAQRFLVSLYTVLWTLLFIIPGIIKSYSYAMTPFVLADNANLTAGEAITRSRQLMDGHKWELFVLDLTFLGWELLGILSFGIGMLWVVPYRNAARAAFYRQISGYPPISQM